MKPVCGALAIYFAAFSSICKACQRLQVESDSIGDIIFTKSFARSSGGQGRSSYISDEGGRIQYLYCAVVNATHGTARWVINGELAVTDHATAYVGKFATRSVEGNGYLLQINAR